MTPGVFTYKGIKSTSFKIISSSVNRSLLPSVRKNLVQIPGRNGNYDFGANTYENRKIEMHIAFIGTSFEELRTRARDIAEWLTSTKEEKLVFDDEPDKYYLARIYDEISIENMAKLGETNISFECSPFAKTEVTKVITTGITGNRNINLTNNGTFEHKPLIEINGTATSITLACSGGNLSISNITEKVYVDCEKMICYTINGLGEKVNKLGSFTGEFIKVHPGALTIAVSGTSMNVAITVDMQDVFV